MTAIGFVGSFVLGLVLTHLYDRRGLHRSALQPAQHQPQPDPRPGTRPAPVD
ncbi:hypothetical protein ACH4CE_16385 [Streptomyces gelaticus]|uniref:hypothetical protein n=1 Tax=Streptomyces gelaticus TaxID=285446 RepID=UPI00378D76A3